MKTKTFAGLIALVLSLVALTGWSCGQGYGVSNWEDTAPTAKTYQNDEWGVRFQYPNGWQYREYRETIEGREEVTLAFSDTTLPADIPPEPIFPVTVFIDVRTVDAITATYAEVVSSEDITLGGKTVKKIVYFSNMLEQNDIVYLAPLNSGTLKFFILQEADYPTIAENMINTLVETE
jgi:hypothetical protein